MNNLDTTNKFDQLRRMAHELIARRPDDCAPAPVGILELVHELKIHQAELKIQNEELRRAQQKLTDLHRQYVDLYEFAPCGYLNLDAKGLITRINLAGVTLLARDRKSLLHTGFSQHVAPRHLDRYLGGLRNAVRTGAKQGLELHLCDDTGSQWVWAEIQADHTSKDDVVQWRITLMDISTRKAVEEALQISENKYRQLFNDMVSGGALLEVAQRDKGGRIMDVRILEVNTAFEHLTGNRREQVLGRSIREIWPQTGAFWFDLINRVMDHAQPFQETGHHRQAGRHFLVSAFRLNDRQLGTTFIDISAQKQIEETLEKARCDLKTQVEAGSVDLRRSNRELHQEIDARRQAQASLFTRTQELQERTTGLEETNITLKVLLKERADERRSMEEKVLANLNQMIRPQLSALTAGPLSPRQQTLVEAVDRSLDDILSPLSRRFVIETSQLTPTETAVANMIRQGKTTKEIADLMGVATSTVDFHRLNIRRKLRLTHKGKNLQSYLRALT